MEQWKELLADVDDDYLIGISNKGILKRAYKDKEEIPAVIEGVEEEASVKVGDETVSIRFPLGESKCTCPSRSICRHVVQAILVLKENCCNDSGAAIENENGADEARTGADRENGKENAAEEVENNAVADAEDGGGSLKETAAENGTGKDKGTSKVLREIEEYPLVQLKKVLGNRQLQILHNQFLSEVRPKIQYSSIVTVQLPEQGTTVKLLAPLEYSSCTCHKKEMCVHKASAILWCQLEAGSIRVEDLALEAADTPAFQMDKAKEGAEQMREFLEELLCTGLSRSSPDVLDYLERLAIISHNGGLAKFEGYFRALSDSYNGYFKRKAQFRTEELTEQITRLYKRVRLLEKAVQSGDSKEVLIHAGEFRADYIPVGNLDLVGIAMEQFQTQTGYEGETIYFLEENTKQWYTYTNARPMFYETGRNRRFMEKSQAPWGLNISIEDMSKVRIHLKGAKCDARKRLSSSQETKGEVIGQQGLEKSDIENWYYEDFGRLFEERIERPRKEWLYGPDEQQKGVELVFVQPAYCVKAEFSQTGQQLSMPLYDREGREIIIEIAYSKKESAAIRYLERISEKEPSCFLGKIYLRDGRIRMYPVMVWKRFTE
ncbi:MAG: hypothetical protein HFH82_03200 [Lachnospiraceae bacterium]|nr:hypothetical protein [Lachnospiraceae bacterium]